MALPRAASVLLEERSGALPQQQVTGHHVAKSYRGQNGRISGSGWAIFGLQEAQDHSVHGSKPSETESAEPYVTESDGQVKSPAAGGVRRLPRRHAVACWWSRGSWATTQPHRTNDGPTGGKPGG